MKNNYSTIIFDLDGTLSDSRAGILNSAIYAAKRLSLPPVDKLILLDNIGIPLQAYFTNLYNTTPTQTTQAVTYFRQYYAEKGAFENNMYPHIFDLLEQLNRKGKNLYIATAKFEKYALVVLDYFNIRQFFKGIVGADAGGIHADKTYLVKKVLSHFNISPGNYTVMVGDKKYDIEAAQDNQIASVGVTYGFGSREEISLANPTHIIHSSRELYGFFI